MIPIFDLVERDARPAPIRATSLADAAASEPEGVYLVARTYRGGMVLELDRHFDRVERSAAELGRTLEVPRRRIRAELERMRRAAGYRDGRFRVTAVLDEPPWWRLSMEPAREVDPELRRDGVRCAVHRGAARVDATVKSTAWMRQRKRLAAQPLPAHDGDRSDHAFTPAEGGGTDTLPVYEHLLADAEGRILEGASSNFYGVIAGELWTAGSGVLEGISRRIVLEIAPAVVPVRLEPPPLADIEHFSEAMISSSTRGILPVRAIDQFALGSPGEVWHALDRGYTVWMEQHLEPLVDHDRR